MSLKQRLTRGNSIANNSIALYLSLAISLIIYCSDSLSPSFTTDQPHHGFSSEVTVQQCIHRVYPRDTICSFMCSFTGLLLLVGRVDLTQCWSVSLGLLPAVAMSSDRGCSCGFVSWHTAFGSRTNFRHPWSVFLLQSLHHPHVAVLTQLFVGPRCGSDRGELPDPNNPPLSSRTKPEAGSVPLVSLTGWSHKWFLASWADGMLPGHRGKEQTTVLALPNTVFL